MKSPLDVDYLVPGQQVPPDGAPIDGTPLVDAVERQLGLLFQPRDEMAEVLAIDRVEPPAPD